MFVDVNRDVSLYLYECVYLCLSGIVIYRNVLE